MILLSVVALSAGLILIVRHRTRWARATRISLAGFIAVNELVWYAYLLHEEGFHFPDTLPLDLCDLTLWLTVITALTLRPRVYEVAYFCGIGGSSMALITPDLSELHLSYPTVHFFVSHGFVVITLLTLTGARLARADSGCVWRAFVILNVYAAAIGTFDAIFKTNYMYLCQKPESASLLDYFGPWPIYILSAEVFALVFFWLLWLPLRWSNQRQR